MCKTGSTTCALVNEIEETFDDEDIVFLRDKNEMRYKDSIRKFMERLGEDKAVIVVLSDAYLKSQNCMFELTAIAEHGDFRNRVFPIVMPDAHIYNPVVKAGYLRFWEQEKDELDQAPDGIKKKDQGSLGDDIDNYAKYRRLMADLLEQFHDMNALTLKHHREKRFADVIEALNG